MWQHFALPEAVVANGGHHPVMNEFSQLFMAAGGPPELALFALPGARDFYATPAAADLVPEFLAAHNAQPSPAPNPAEACLLVGDNRAWDLLTPITEIGE